MLDNSKSTPIAGVLDASERLNIETRFGVAAEQVARDHVISHALAAIASVGTDSVVFFGGTALSRTLLSDVRLSEDIDLIAMGARREVGDRIEAAITRRFRRSFGTAVFTPRIRDTRPPDPAVLHVDATRIQIQLLSSAAYPAWPTEVVTIEQRYSDAPPAKLRVLTTAGFVASKLAAWNDREAPRDLYDLWALARLGKIDAEASEVFSRHGSYTSLSQVSFTRPPSEAAWEAALSHQCRPAVGPGEAARIVEEAISQL
ncbi:nucleotidyl transferase AbiEii/AbiGii toxin family protein [Microbacterium sp. SLBN-146]|uniref:nucleotidyl transferase AbiEii/AbiGii toxin family protein n=1 Tax=Microbacterium sp. SLBN-146 TaxID=2768457 RepID=UPI00114F62BB|nr:nucleotidyl transferase AbiEii/AbiGii toxin family protein [Microbacterium sp. SLBN-146]TQJ29608.1 putative nucleotidyltransferase component of viral defense system [Microbacterium sp. SLBN-146]